jgi:serine/threonine protein kinase
MANYYMGQKPTREAFGEVELVLSDWGVATWAEPSRRRTDDVVPLLLQSPELLLQAPWDAKVDIWATACIFLGLAEGERLFNGQGPLANGWGYDPEWHLAEIAEVLGDFPTSLLQTGNPDIVNYAFDGQGKLIAARPHRNPPLHEWIAHIWGESRDQFIDLLYGMLTLDPDHRPSAGELLEAPWFAASQTNTTKKALPEQEVKVDLDAVQSESGMALTEKHVTIAPNGTGYVTPEDDQHAPDDHVQKKVKLSSAGIAMPDRREVRDLPMEDIDNVSAAEEVDLDLLMRDPPAGDPKQPPASDAETPVNTSTQDDSGASNSFLDVSGNGAKSDTAEIVDSKALQRPYWAEVIRGGYWFAKEVVVFVLGRL